MPTALDDLMQTASEALAELDYARCETLCLDALQQARDAEDWAMARRVLLPLQEARRQKRQAAIDGLILLGTPERPADLSTLIADPRCGCIVLTRPCSPTDAAEIDALLRGSPRAVEVLFADNTLDAQAWSVTTFLGAAVRVNVPAPAPAWVGKWTSPIGIAPPTPAHWFMQASEALGTAAIELAPAPAGSIERFDQLADALAAVGDHEILHQRLADAARDLHEARR